MHMNETHLAGSAEVMGHHQKGDQMLDQVSRGNSNAGLYIKENSSFLQKVYS